MSGGYLEVAMEKDSGRERWEAQLVESVTQRVYEALGITMDQDIGREHRERAVRPANGTLALEGLRVTDEAREDQERYIRGELTIEEILERTTQRHKKN